MRPCIRVEASQEQEVTLKMWAGSWKVEWRLAMRAKLVLLSLEGLSLKEISEQVGLRWQACLKWRKRFLKSGIDGLIDKAGRGRSQVIGPERRVEIIALACTEPGEGRTRWSVRKLAEQTGHSKSLIQQILSEAAIKPHKTKYWCGKSPDPEFEAKQAAIVGRTCHRRKKLWFCVLTKNHRFRLWTEPSPNSPCGKVSQSV